MRQFFGDFRKLGRTCRESLSFHMKRQIPTGFHFQDKTLVHKVPLHPVPRESAIILQRRLLGESKEFRD